eukprot:6569570-Pyramimonas_sp.AAC.1
MRCIAFASSVARLRVDALLRAEVVEFLSDQDFARWLVSGRASLSWKARGWPTRRSRWRPVW